MQTFKVDLSIAIKAVIPAEFLAESRKEAQAETATPFLKHVQEEFPEDDDSFMLAILCNALRTNVRAQAIHFLTSSSVGGTVSPVQILTREVCRSVIVGEREPSVQLLQIGQDKLIVTTEEQVA